MANKLGMSTGKGYHSGIYNGYATEASRLQSIVITSYEDLKSYIPQYPNANYNTYAVSINERPITFPDGTVIHPWCSGMLIVEADASLILTCSDGSIISAYHNNVSNTWEVQKLKQKPDEASKADSASGADVATVVSASAVYKYGQSVSIEQTGVYVVGIGKMTGKLDYYSLPTTAIILIDNLDTSKAVVVSATSNNTADTTSYSTNLVFDGSNKLLFAKDAGGELLDLTVMRIAEIDNPK